MQNIRNLRLCTSFGRKVTGWKERKKEEKENDVDSGHYILLYDDDHSWEGGDNA